MKDQKTTNYLSDAATKVRQGRSGVLKLLYPGMGIKRWLLTGASGIAVASIGVAFLLRKILALGFPNFLQYYLEGIVLLMGGGFVILISIYGLFHF